MVRFKAVANVPITTRIINLSARVWGSFIRRIIAGTVNNLSSPVSNKKQDLGLRAARRRKMEPFPSLHVSRIQLRRAYVAFAVWPAARPWHRVRQIVREFGWRRSSD